MGMFNDFAFAAVDTFLKSEVQKLIDQWLSDNGVDQLAAMIPNSGRPLKDFRTGKKISGQELKSWQIKGYNYSLIQIGE